MWAGQQCMPSAIGVEGDSETGYARRWGGSPGRSVAYRRARLQEKSWASLCRRAEQSEGGTIRGCPSRCAASVAGGQGLSPTDSVGSGRSLRSRCEVGKAGHMGKGGSGSAVTGLECQEAAGEHQRAVANV